MSGNGARLMKIVEDNDLVVVNATEKCKGLITRYRVVEGKEEKSTIDFFIVCKRFFNFIEEMNIDEHRINTLAKFTNKKERK